MPEPTDSRRALRTESRRALRSIARLEARLETRWWTGPAAHLVAGALDWITVLAAFQLARARRRLGRQ